MTEHLFLLPVGGEEWALSSTLLQTPHFQLALTMCGCVAQLDKCWCCCGSQVWIVNGKLKSPSCWPLLKALETSTEHQVTGSWVTSCCFDAASLKENLFGPCSLSSFLFIWNTYLCSLQELCTLLNCSGIYLDYQRQCWWSQSWFRSSLKVCLAQHCMSTGSQSGNFVDLLEGLSSSGLCCDRSGDVTAYSKSSLFGTRWCISCATPPCLICWWMV